MVTEKTRTKIVDSYLDLIKEKESLRIPYPLLAERAGIKLGSLREAFPSNMTLLENFIARIDRQVLDQQSDDMGDQPSVDRLFDILMRRLDALSPYKDAVKVMAKAVRSDPVFAFLFNKTATRSQMWMLSAAAIDPYGLKGRVKAQGLALVFADTLQVWFDDTSDMPKTMAYLDKRLRRGHSNLKRVEGIASLFCCLSRRGKKTRPRAEEARA